MSIEDWMMVVADHDVDDLEIDSDHAAEEFLRRVAEFGERPRELLATFGGSSDDFMTTLAWATREAVLEFLPPFELRKRVVQLLPDILRAACDLNSADAVFGFWDVFLIPWELRFTWHFLAPNVDRTLPIIEEVKESLIRQISMSNYECLQLSALHGINHLKDKETADRARSFEATFTAETRQYAESALAFHAL